MGHNPVLAKKCATILTWAATEQPDNIVNQPSLLFTQAPRWHQADFGAQKQLPAALRSWLLETDSLTQRLKTIHGQNFSVQVLQHHWQHAFIDEARLLGQNYHRYQLVREVILFGGFQPLILARTIIPASTLRVAERKLNHLGSRPLGEVIFAYPDLRIQQRQFSHLQHSLVQNSLQIADTDDLWGRRSIYEIHQHPLLVAEYFLPACWQY